MSTSLPVLEPPGVEDILDRIGSRQKRVHINLGPVCNNNCIFCMEEDREMRYVVNSALTPDRVNRILERNAGASEVCFTSGEPTLVEELPAYASRARELGYERISVMTNARKLSFWGYAVKLVKSGMNFFYISIHGDEKRLHDSLVRTPGAFEQTLAGLDNVTKLKRFGVTLHTSTVVTKRNMPRFREIYGFLRSHGVDQVVFNVMQANGRADTYFDQLFPTYSEIASHFRRFIRETGHEEPQAFLVDIPLCTTEDIPDLNRGYVERYVHFELNDGAPKDAAAMRAMERSDGEFLEVAREDLDFVEREKRDRCRECRYDSACEGVWKNYLSRYGWDEFEPVFAAEK